MSSLYLIRHGQAGSRDNYDVLSETGRLQARLLGEYFRSSGIRFQAAYTGSMRRQRQTAEIALAQMEGAPEIQLDPRWNEFNLESLWKKLAPRMLAEDGQFARDYAALHQGNVDRVMTACDVQLIRAWVANHHQLDGIEPWGDFRARVESPRRDLLCHAPGEAVAVFTSATPTAIWCGSALGVDERRIFRLAGVLFNAAFSTLRLREEELTLFSLNNTPHLPEGPLRTFR
ncbi:MAG: histidine phosphatase family protein [Acidobacteria bacterium]|nr:histidine phosphatase family protein [Acidobacteriota bacterium]